MILRMNVKWKPNNEEGNRIGDGMARGYMVTSVWFDVFRSMRTNTKTTSSPTVTNADRSIARSTIDLLLFSHIIINAHSS
mmetsp:Transcript_30210/g.88345  ORF Transcript_30210/g.88345 Transcript_30210/m.88345 type:complete len:80 (+) Transcript_30210:502-741(+)